MACCRLALSTANECPSQDPCQRARAWAVSSRDSTLAAWFLSSGLPLDSMLLRNSRFSAGDIWFIFTSSRCCTCRAPGETVKKASSVIQLLTILATHSAVSSDNGTSTAFLNRKARGSVSGLRLEQLWRLVILVHRFVFSCRHDLSLPHVVLHQSLR